MKSKNLGEVLSGPIVSEGHLILNYTSGTGCGGKFYTTVKLICKKDSVVCIIIPGITRPPLHTLYVVLHVSVVAKFIFLFTKHKCHSFTHCTYT